MENNTVKNNTNTARKQTFSGIVVSDKMKDTAVVVVERYVKDREFKKFTIIRKRYKVHDIGNTKKIGDKVTIESCKPISKDKSFKIIA
ncbi:MAG TPA: 30S ribosomal protein S17 [Candidatus Paceibacterota bacterium]